MVLCQCDFNLHWPKQCQTHNVNGPVTVLGTTTDMLVTSIDTPQRCCRLGSSYRRRETRQALGKPFKSMLEEFDRQSGNVTYVAKLPKAALSDTGDRVPGFLNAFEQPTLVTESFDEPDWNR